MTTISAFAALAAKQRLEPYVYEPAALGPHDIEITITHCGVCHSDINLLDNDWNRSVYPFVPGHEIVGVVAAVGTDSKLTVGQRVGVGWQRSSCLACAACLRGEENLCAQQEATCIGHPGGFAQRIRTDGRFAFAIPEGLDSAATSPLLCGGVTVFAPLRRYGVKRGDSVGVIGIGGLGHLALRFLAKMGAEITVFSSTERKRDEALRLGAHHVAISTDAREIRKHAGRFDLLLSTAPAKLDWLTYLETVRAGGVFCLVGAPPGLMTIMPSLLVLKQRTVCGSDIGSRANITDMLAFAAEHKIGAQVELEPLTNANAAIDKLRANNVFYRMVLFSDADHT